MLPQPLNPSPLLVFQDLQNQLTVSPFVQEQEEEEASSSVSTTATSDNNKKKKQVVARKAAAIRKAKKSVRWGSAYSYNSNLRNPEDISLMWYTSSDLEQFQRDKRKVIRALKHVRGDLTVLEHTKYVTRGFECYQSVPFNRRIRKQRQAVVKSVLALQQLQQQQQQSNNSETTTATTINDNGEALAQVARTESAWARDFALSLGQKDATNVEMGWKEFFAMEVTTTSSNSSESDEDDEAMECITKVFQQTATTC